MKEFLKNEEARVVVVVVLVLLAAEIALRKRLPALSLDHAHLQSIPAVVESMRNDPLPKILVMGNSQARQGIDEHALLAGCQSNGNATISLYRFVPDGGSINTWSFAWTRFFSSPQTRPSMILLCGAQAHFRDGVPNARDIGANYLLWNDLFHTITRYFSTTEDRLNLCASWFSRSFANAYRVHRRMLDMLTPRYRLAAQVINEKSRNLLTSAHLESATTPKTRNPSLHRLREFIEMRTYEGSDVVVVNMPNFINYKPPHDIATVVDQAGGTYLDLRNASGIDAEAFVDPFGTDPYHLNKRGAAIFTRVLKEALSEKLKALSGAPHPL